MRSPKDRAKAVLRKLDERSPFIPEPEDEADIAEAIRAAEVAALRRAAREVEALATGLEECEEIPCDHSASEQALATAKRIRALESGGGVADELGLDISAQMAADAEDA